MSSFSGLLSNAVLLLALGVIYDALGLHAITDKRLRDLISGLLVGLVGIAVMLTPWELAPGIFFDTRWVLISLCALFFGLVPTLVAVAMTVAFRLFQGGAGAMIGSLVIISSAVIGLGWHRMCQKRDWRLSGWNLYLFGVLVQLTVIGCMLLMPAEVRFKIIAAVAAPMLAIYPIGTMLLGLVLRRQRDRRQAEQELRENRQLLDRERGLLRGLIDSMPDIIFFKDTQGNYLGCNQAFEQLVNMTEQEIVGKTGLDLFDQEAAERFREQDHIVLTGGKLLSSDEWVDYPDGQRRMMNTLKAPFRGLDGTLYGLAGICRDFSDRWLAEEEREQLQDRLVQAQKMESVGQLAGGVAHDFNNMLGVILGQAELGLMRLEDRIRVKKSLVEIQRAAERSADLTRQLLAFARKQAIVPQVMDLNESIPDMFNMLGRLIGEEIELNLRPGKGLWQVKFDPSQLDQILTNLCVNARDAIDGVGKITIETGNSTLDQAWCKSHKSLSPGEYVVLSVSDTGQGMDGDMRTQIFEPFFSTKKIGQGTGLGLATVFGIVKQNHGHIDVYSEPDHGTSFKIYLPRSQDAIKPTEQQTSSVPEGGDETVLLVEDEPAILNMAQEMLSSLGYRVLTANGPGEAIAMATAHEGDIHLVLTDVVMPEMNGLDLSRRLLDNYPGIKQLFMSGYTANIIAQHGVLDEGVQFIEKPFSLQSLSRKIKEALAV